MNTTRKKPKDYALALRRVAKDTWSQMQECQLFLIASSLSFTTVLSIIPLLAVSFAIFQAFGGLDKVFQLIEPLVLDNLAKGTGEQTIQAIRGFIENIHAGTMGASGLIMLILTSMSMLSSVEKAVNRVWKTSINRTFFHRVTSYWFFISLGPLASAVSIGALSSAEISVKSVVPHGFGGFFLTVLVFFSIYKWVPNRKVNWFPPIIAAITTAIFWSIAKSGYALYTSRILTYNKIYGSLGAIPIFFLWIYIIWLITLTGAALTAALQKRLDLA